jgi:hypothetical protein
MSLFQDIKSILRVLFQVFVLFPYSALTIPRQRFLPGPKERDRMKSKNDGEQILHRDISERLYGLCTAEESVSRLLAEEPGLAPGDAWKRLYGHGLKAYRNEVSTREHQAPAQTRNERAADCGHWGPTKPSDLFLTVRISSQKPSLTHLLTRLDVPRCTTRR